MKEINGKLTSALGELIGHWDAGELRKALKLAAKWPQLGEHKGRIQKGWSAASSPDMYRGMGQDPLALYQDGLAALIERYGLTPIDLIRETTDG